ncbi:MAG: esterase family protein [Roseburia sp.]|nr:esterase family protein [Anaeroplasma bactoclasticum]MCM1195699.1 esterase family protein [Roseburia sp.]MCM1556365.1 esterase family protein [Anaeroplasma bactoclasticum]
MLEGFKINCFPLNRAIRVSIALPKDYNNTSRYYPVIYFLDGQNLYKDEDSYRGVSLELEKIIEELAFEEKEAIYVGVAAASNPERRVLEYESKTLAEFIISTIHPYLSSRYRINDYVYSFGCSEACYTAITLNQSEIFKGMILLSPILNMDLVRDLSIQENNLCYIYSGKSEENGVCFHNTNSLKEIFTNAKIVTDENAQHNEAAWKSKVLDALNYLVL